ncbi:MAG: hypothetical protein M9890_07260 [Thermomicrobiales bacterium]|nr:hypothetical protein [Thermomicrobiales bacterium]
MSVNRFTLTDGSAVTIHDSSVTLEPRAGASLLIDCTQITTVSRGGTELIVARREADPLRMQAASIADARAIEQALQTCCGISPLYRARWNPEEDA